MSWMKGIQWSQSALCVTAVGSERVYSWFHPIKWPERGNAFTAKMFIKLSVVEHIPWVEWYLGGASMHNVPLQWAHKVHI